MEKNICCEKCLHINLVGPLSRNYCSDADCPCHQPPTEEKWSKERGNLYKTLHIFPNLVQDVLDSAYLAGLEEGSITPAPKDSPEWEEEFDKKFGDKTGPTNSYYIHLKSFIKQHIAKAKEEERAQQKIIMSYGRYGKRREAATWKILTVLFILICGLIISIILQKI